MSAYPKPSDLPLEKNLFGDIIFPLLFNKIGNVLKLTFS